MPCCSGKANRQLHPTTRMVYVKSWEMQGQHQKKPIVIELWKCPYVYTDGLIQGEQCGRLLRVKGDKNDKSEQTVIK